MGIQKSINLSPLILISCFAITLLLICPSSCKTDQVISSPALSKSIPDKIDFNLHVKPILSDRCFKCHGPDPKVREAGLRFDTKEGTFAALGENKDHQLSLERIREFRIL